MIFEINISENDLLQKNYTICIANKIIEELKLTFAS